MSRVAGGLEAAKCAASSTEPWAGSPQEMRGRTCESDVGASEELREPWGLGLRLSRLKEAQLIGRQDWRVGPCILQLGWRAPGL